MKLIKGVTVLDKTAKILKATTGKAQHLEIKVPELYMYNVASLLQPHGMTKDISKDDSRAKQRESRALRILMRHDFLCVRKFIRSL